MVDFMSMAFAAWCQLTFVVMKCLVLLFAQLNHYIMGYLSLHSTYFSATDTNHQSYWTRCREAKKIVQSWHTKPVELLPHHSQPDKSSSLNNQTFATGFSFQDSNQDSQAVAELYLMPYSSYMDEQTSAFEHFLSNSETSEEMSCFDTETIASDIGSSEDDEMKLGHELVEWAQTCKIKISAVDKLLPILKSKHSQLPVTYKSLLNRVKTGSQKCQPLNITSGEYIHFGILEGLLSCINSLGLQNERNIKYQVNVDGLPLFKSSSQQLWPIIGKVVGTKCLFLIGAFNGKSKPADIDEFLQPFVMESIMLSTEGFLYQDKHFTATVDCFICDCPARAYLKQIKGHTGYLGCERCLTHGDYHGGRMTYSSTCSEKRKDEEFSAMKYEGHQLNRTPLMQLNIGLVSGFILDSMHLVYLGVVRRLLKSLLKGDKSVRLSARQADVISGKLVCLARHIPVEFARKPRSFKEIDRWKASEFRQFLMYSGMLVLKSEVNADIYDNFACLSVAIYILSSPPLHEYYSGYAEQLLQYFVDDCKRIYGKIFVVYNVHSLLHLTDDVRKFGCLDSISSFPFEDFLGRIKRCVRKPQSILQQIGNRLSDGYLKSKCNPFLSTAVTKEHESGPVVSGLLNLRQFRQVHLRAGFIVKSKTGDNCVCFGAGRIGLVCNIFSDGSEQCTSLLLHEFCTKEPFFTKPLISTDIGIYKLSNIDKNFHICNVSEVVCKYVLLPEQEKNHFIAIPLLHTL